MGLPLWHQRPYRRQGSPRCVTQRATSGRRARRDRETAGRASHVRIVRRKSVLPSGFGRRVIPLARFAMRRSQDRCGQRSRNDDNLQGQAQERRQQDGRVHRAILHESIWQKQRRCHRLSRLSTAHRLQACMHTSEADWHGTDAHGRNSERGRGKRIDSR